MAVFLGLGLLITATAHAQISSGTDVIVGDLPSMANYETAGDYDAFAVGTTSCNIGDEGLTWISSTNQHPVIGMNMFRLKDGRFEQIGVSWLKHGFFALQGTLCEDMPDIDCVPGSGSLLGVGCSDPYGAGLNGSQGNGPRWEVNAATGFFEYPHDAGVNTDSTSKRIRVHVDDLDPTLNDGALYYVEGHYIQPEDAAADNDNNNASWRPLSVTAGTGTQGYNASTTGTTQRMDPAIYAWQDEDAEVEIVPVDVDDDGRFLVGYRVTDNGDGTWTYEYAVHNLNSERSGASFAVPLSVGSTLTDIGFHDVEYHSGEPYDNTDWTVTQSADQIIWEVDGTYDAGAPRVDDTANALRWGTLYNFRFTCNAAPVEDDLTIGLYKPAAAGATFTDDEVTFPGLRPDSGEVNVCAYVGDGVQLGWLPAAAYTSIEVARDGELLATLIDGEAGYFDANTTPGDYSYTVTGYDGATALSESNCGVTVPAAAPAGFNFYASDETLTLTPGTFGVDLSIDEDAGHAGFPNAIDGFSMGVSHDDGLLSAVSISSGADLSELNGGDGPDFFAGLIWERGITIGCLFDFELVDTIPGDADAVVATVDYELVDGAFDGHTAATAVVLFSDTLGTPNVINQVNTGVEVQFPEPFGGVLAFGDDVPPRPVEFRRGDVDSNGVTFPLLDAIFLLEWAFNAGPAPICEDAADVDDNGVLFALVDVIALLDWGFNAADPPAAPGPDVCGADGTPTDALGCEATSANCQ